MHYQQQSKNNNQNLLEITLLHIYASPPTPPHPPTPPPLHKSCRLHYLNKGSHGEEVGQHGGQALGQTALGNETCLELRQADSIITFLPVPAWNVQQMSLHPWQRGGHTKTFGWSQYYGLFILRLRVCVAAAAVCKYVIYWCWFSGVESGRLKQVKQKQTRNSVEASSWELLVD